MTTVLLVALGSALGAPSRHLLDQLVDQLVEQWVGQRVRRSAPRLLPWGTLVVNLTGTFALGVLIGCTGPLGGDPLLVTAVGTGFLGSYTTFSTFTWETVQLLEERAMLAALGNVLLSVCAGLVAVVAGIALGGGW